MRKILLSAATFLTILAASAQVPSYVSTNGLVGYWPFNGNAQDASGNGNHGTVHGASLTSDRNGNLNASYLFNGSSNYIDCGSFTSISNPIGNITQSAWVFAATNQSSFCKMPIISKRQDISQSWPTLGGGANGSIGFPVNNQAYFFVNANNYVNGVSNALHSTNTTNDGVWHLITGTKNGNEYKLYFDGILQSTLIDNYNLSSTNNLYIGYEAMWGFDCERWFSGKLDDIGIWNRALTQQEITTLYQGCSNPTATITPQGITTFCQGGSVNLNASTSTNYAYEWYNNGNIINNANSNVYNATVSGNYTVKVTDGACNATSTVKTVTVNTNPTVTLNALNNVVYKTSLPIQLVGNPSGGTYSGNAITGSTFTPANATLGKKTISYNYTTQQGCSGSESQTTIVVDSVGNVCSTYDTLKIKVKFTLGLYANKTNTIKFYPNPTKDVLFIDNGNYQAMNGYFIKIVSLTGAVVYNQSITSQQVQISMNQFATKGLYIAQILDSNNAIIDSKKIVLE